MEAKAVGAYSVAVAGDPTTVGTKKTRATARGQTAFGSGHLWPSPRYGGTFVQLVQGEQL